MKTTRPAPRVAGERDDLLQHVLACGVLRVRLARDHELHAAGASSRSRSLKTSARALVRREAPREADRQRVRRRAPSASGEPLPSASPLDAAQSSSRSSCLRGLPAASRRRRLRAARPRLRSSASSSGASHVPRWTPFVTCSIGAARAGGAPSHISRATSPCSSRDAVRAVRESRNASGVSPNPSVPFARPSREQLVVREARLRRAGSPRSGSTSSSPNTSLPAGTGVCVVKTVVAATRSSASRRRAAALDELARTLDRRGTPSGPRSRGRRVGASPSASSARTPPTPSSSSCRIRCSRSPLYERVGHAVDVEQVQRHRADVVAPHRGRRRSRPSRSTSTVTGSALEPEATGSSAS